jgi:NAD+ kinase
MSQGASDRQQFRTVALIGKYQSAEVAAALEPLAAFLRAQGIAVLLEEGTAAATAPGCPCPAASYETIGMESDVAVVIGGDGTMLHAARRLAEYNVPLVGINLGRLGFMTDIARERMIDGIKDLLAGRFSVERRFLLAAEMLRGGERVFHTLALNDAVVSKGDIGRLIDLEVRVDGEFLYVLRADGMIVATPTGSTAYALSANGPILHPAVPGIALVPLCPHALSYRPITISDASTVELTLLAPHSGSAHFDGQTRCDMRAGDCVRLARAGETLTLLHPPGYSYFAMLREKLHWSAAPKH